MTLNKRCTVFNGTESSTDIPLNAKERHNADLQEGPRTDLVLPCTQCKSRCEALAPARAWLLRPVLANQTVRAVRYILA